MNKQELLTQINQWKKEMAHQKIIDAINAVPEGERDYQLTCILAREYNITNNFPRAKELLDSVRKEGMKDPNWFFHSGYSLMSMRRFAEAKGAFQQCLKLAPQFPNVRTLLSNCELNIGKEVIAKAYGDGKELDEDKTLEMILKCHLHGNFGVKDTVEDDHIHIPAWNISIYPEITELKEDSVIVNFNLECPDWDRDILEVSASKGPNPAVALNVVCSSFMLSLMSAITLMAKKERVVKMESEFAGQKHQWNVYRGNVLSGGEAQKIRDFNLYWDALKDELVKRIGNQKLCYVKVFASKNGETVNAECRINDVRIPSLSKIVGDIAKAWDIEGYGIQRQFFLFQQEESTTQPYPFDQESLEDYTREAMKLFANVRSAEDAKALPEKMLELCGDTTLAKELQLYLPMAAAESAYKQLIHPETLTFDKGGEKLTVYRSQLASYHTIEKAMFWALQNQVFGEETNRVYQSMVVASPLFHFVQKAVKEGKAVQGGMGISQVINLSDSFQLR